jgi:Leucine-rich repeat (LRR) protein
MQDDNSSEYALDAHNRGIVKIASLSEVRGFWLCSFPADSIPWKVPKLRALDLSFNKIQNMENLEALPDLCELKLYHNRIEEIENLEG